MIGESRCRHARSTFHPMLGREPRFNMHIRSRLSDRALLENWRAGDARSGGELLARHHAGLLRFFQRRAGADADELLQGTWLACVESFQRIRGEATFRTYVFSIARNELYRYYRERSQRLRQLCVDELALIDPQPSSPERLADLQRIAALAEALAQLPEADRALLHDVYAQDIQSPALAREHGIAPSSLRARLHRARRELAQRMEQPRANPRSSRNQRLRAARELPRERSGLGPRRLTRT
jgi:RNA polymerase sigma factor (sigma-70 family)